MTASLEMTSVPDHDDDPDGAGDPIFVALGPLTLDDIDALPGNVLAGILRRVVAEACEDSGPPIAAFDSAWSPPETASDREEWWPKVQEAYVSSS